jgi:hypothetical protein
VSICWFGILLAAWSVNANAYKATATQSLLMMIYFLRVMAVFAAVGALFGRALLSAMIGTAVFVAIVAVLLLLVRLSGHPLAV